MRIHQITHLFHPDQLAGASLYSDLAKYFLESGHDIRVTTTFPYYPALQFSDEHRGVLRKRDDFDGIPLKRVGMWLPKKHKGLWRLVPEITYLPALMVAGRFNGWKPDVVITACPMLSQVAWQRSLYAGREVPKLVIVQDLMAHAAADLGIIRSRGVGNLLKRFERWSLRSASLLTTISAGMKHRIDAITQGAPPCDVVPNWIHKPLANAIAVRRGGVRRERLSLFYSGNFGVKQGLPGFLEDLHQVRGAWRIRLHGGGPETAELSRTVSGWGDWLTLGGLLDEGKYVDALLYATACVITQRRGAGANFLPSKLLPALAAGTPVLAVCDADSPLGREVMDGGFGEVIAPGDKLALKETLNRWSADPNYLRRYSESALIRARFYSRDVVCRQYEQLLETLVHRPRTQ